MISRSALAVYHQLCSFIHPFHLITRLLINATCQALLVRVHDGLDADAKPVPRLCAGAEVALERHRQGRRQLADHLGGAQLGRRRR
jgi:hypothetical protein